MIYSFVLLGQAPDRADGSPVPTRGEERAGSLLTDKTDMGSLKQASPVESSSQVLRPVGQGLGPATSPRARKDAR